MKKFLTFLFLSTLAIPAIALAAQTGEPTVDEVASPINANKISITGSADANAKIIITGGPYDIAPVYADESGDFSVTVSLIQESTNTFFIQAQNEDEDPSDAVEIEIVESDEKAAEYEAATGMDRTAPNAPDLEETEVTTDELTYTIKGSGEVNSTVIISGAGSYEEGAGSDGDFEIKVDLTGSETKDTFSVSLKDLSGNISSATKISITSSATKTEEDTDNEEDESSDETEFTDLDGHWGEEYILKLADLKIVSGYGNGKFGPNDYVTRSQILKMALLAFDHEVSDEKEEQFTDVSNDDWYYSYVTYAKSIDIIEGYDDETFRPDNYVDRAAALKIILGAFGAEIDDSITPSNFTDVDSGAWYSLYAAYAYNEGIIEGYDDGTFRGGQYITRAEVAKIIAVMID